MPNFRSFRPLPRRASRFLPLEEVPSQVTDLYLVKGRVVTIAEACEAVLSGRFVRSKLAAADILHRCVELSAHLDDWALSAILPAAEDLTFSKRPPEVRKAGFNLFTLLAKHAADTQTHRLLLFESMTSYKEENFLPPVSSLVELTNRGRDVSAFESRIVPLVIRLLDEGFKASSTARKRDKDRNSKTTAVLPEDANLAEVFSFANMLMQGSGQSFKTKELLPLLNQVSRICKKTTASADVLNSIVLFSHIFQYGGWDIFPPGECFEAFDQCVNVLCGAYSTLKDLSEPVWNAFSNLRSMRPDQDPIYRLLNVLPPLPFIEGDRNTNTIRGAVLLLNRLILADTANTLDEHLITMIFEAFLRSLAIDSTRLESDMVEIVNQYLARPQFMEERLNDDQWALLFAILVHCSKRVSGKGENRNRAREQDASLFSTIARFLDLLREHCRQSISPDRVTIMDYIHHAPSYVPDCVAEIIIDQYLRRGLLRLFARDWEADIVHLTNIIFADVSRATSLRFEVLNLIRISYEDMIKYGQLGKIVQRIVPLFDTMERETNSAILEAQLPLAVDIACLENQAVEALTDEVLIRLLACIPLKPSGWSAQNGIFNTESMAIQSKSQSLPQSLPATRFAVAAIARIFIRSLDSHGPRAKRMLNLMLEIMKSVDCGSAARMTVLKVLLRLRSEVTGAVFLTSISEVEAVSSTVGRNIDSRGPKNHSLQPTRARQSRRESTDPSQGGQSISAGFSSSPTLNNNEGATDWSGIGTGPLERRGATPEEQALPELPRVSASSLVFSHNAALVPLSPRSDKKEYTTLSINVWLEVVISILQQEEELEVYGYVLSHLGAQLTNHSLFRGSVPQIKMLRNVICEQLRIGSYREPPPSSDLKKSDIMMCLFHTLTILLTYHEHFSKNEEDEIVRIFVIGLGSGENAAKHCIHSLWICCHEVPLSVSKSLNNILQKMSQIITQPRLAVHILEFLASLARLPKLYVNFREDDYRTVFGVCFRYLQYARDQRQRNSGLQSASAGSLPERQSRTKRDSGPSYDTTPSLSTSTDLPQYVYALAYHVITFWFMSIKLVERSKYVSWIIKNLVLNDSSGVEVIEEQSQVIIDMMQRVAYSDVDETSPDPDFSSTDGLILKKTWLVGLSIWTIETATGSGASQLTKRQPSSTTYSVTRPRVAQRPAHQIPLSSQTATDIHEGGSRVEVLPEHILLQLTTNPGRVPRSQRPIPLPEDDFTNRAIRMFDRNSTVDGHKVGVIYVGEGQTSEVEILANTHGSNEYAEFLDQLGTLTGLKDATFNTQGLDRESGMDGDFTYCWRDRVTEMVFHVATMMPTDMDGDPRCLGKKRHTGNDFVNIIFNDSSLPFRFDTMPSEFNYVNIVITPESRLSRHTGTLSRHANPRLAPEPPRRRFFKVQVMSKPGFPEISPAAKTKLISDKNLAAFVRLIALNASVFSLVWANREGGEHISSWRNRLREIVRLREKYARAAVGSSSNVTTPGGSSGQRESLNKLRRTSGPSFFGDGLAGQRSSVVSNAAATTDSDGFAEDESLADGYDFSKWAGG